MLDPLYGATMFGIDLQFSSHEFPVDTPKVETWHSCCFWQLFVSHLSFMPLRSLGITAGSDSVWNASGQKYKLKILKSCLIPRIHDRRSFGVFGRKKVASLGWTPKWDDGRGIASIHGHVGCFLGTSLGGTCCQDILYGNGLWTPRHKVFAPVTKILNEI